MKPARGFDLGAGPGKALTRTIRGGTVGVILDARGRSLSLPEERSACRAAVSGAIDAIDLYGDRSVPAEGGAV